MEGIDTAGRAERLVSIVVAPSERLTTLAALLQAVARTRQVERVVDVRALEDLYELANPRDDRGQLVLDADVFELEDLGLVRRFVARSAHWQVLVLGTDASRSVARALLGLERARWIAWPLDVTQVENLIEAAAPAPAARASVTSASPATGAVDLHAQVAMLADISQRLELAFAAWRESGRAPTNESEGAAAELRRLVHFTRTLSCTIAPPARGDDEFDPPALIDELLTASALRGRKGPRFVARAPHDNRNGGGYLVRADRAAIALAIEAVLGLAAQCASSGEVVRVLYATQDGELAITVEFAAGPLSGIAPERLLEPNVIRERLSEYGVNDLPAAAAILHSQGGEFALADTGTGALAVQMRLPLIQLSSAAPTKGGGSARPAPARTVS